MTKRVVITGASSGIGRELALLLAGQCQLVLAARREALLSEMDMDAVRVGCDVTDKEDVRRLLAAAKAPGVEPVLVNSVGAAEFGDFAEMPLSSIDLLFQANLIGPAYTCHAFIPWMLEEEQGQIINVLSIAATATLPGAAVYSAAKAGLHSLTKVLAAEYRRKGIRVTSLIPGSTDTPLWDAQGWVPPKEDMLSAKSVAEAIRDLIFMPRDRSVDELVLMPPKGIL